MRIRQSVLRKRNENDLPMIVAVRAPDQEPFELLFISEISSSLSTVFMMNTVSFSGIDLSRTDLRSNRAEQFSPSVP